MIATPQKTRNSYSRTKTKNNKLPRRLRARAEESFNNEISFIGNDLFKEPAARRKILTERIRLEFVSDHQLKRPAKLPSYLARLCEAPLLENEDEAKLFCLMNCLLYRANELRSKLSVARPNEAKLDAVDDLLSQANAVKNRIVAANIRLVVSIVKQLTPDPSMFEEMFSDGLLAMIRATEKFDFDRGFRFSTYATMVVRRQLYRSMKNDHRDRTRFPAGDQSLFDNHSKREPDPRIGYHGWVELNSSLANMMTELDERERLIIRARFGFDTDGKKQTLQSLATEMGVCKERVRQLEKRAMAKLRAVARENELESLLSPELHQ